MAPPRTYQTAFLADVILRYPGPVIATTTKPDVYGLTAAVRSELGPVHVFNPQRIGDVRSTFRWSPVDGCQDPATAIRRADAFAFAVSHKGVEDRSEERRVGKECRSRRAPCQQNEGQRGLAADKRDA